MWASRQVSRSTRDSKRVCLVVKRAEKTTFRNAIACGLYRTTQFALRVFWKSRTKSPNVALWLDPNVASPIRIGFHDFVAEWFRSIGTSS